MKKVLRTFLQTASLCAVVVMLTMGINAILGVNISISYYMVMLAGFVVLSFIWSFGMYLLQLKGLGAPVKQNIRSKKSVSSVRKTNYDYQTNNVRKRKVS